MITLIRKKDEIPVDFNVADISELKCEFDTTNNLVRINDEFYVLSSLQSSSTITPTRPILDQNGDPLLTFLDISFIKSQIQDLRENINCLYFKKRSTDTAIQQIQSDIVTIKEDIEFIKAQIISHS